MGFACSPVWFDPVGLGQWGKAVDVRETEGHGCAGAVCSPKPLQTKEGEKAAALSLWRGTAVSAIATVQSGSAALKTEREFYCLLSW